MKGPDFAPPAGLEIRWTGDAVIGRDYMANVQTSLDRAAVATVVLLLCVLLAVYRSIWLALVPLATIGASLVISRGILAWMMLAGWELSPLVELFLIAILFGTGTDFCLFLSWRYAEHLNPNNPAGSMRVTLARSFSALVTSAGTIIIGLLVDGDDEIQALFEHGPERRPQPGCRLGRHADTDPGAAGDAGANPPARIRRPGRHFTRFLGQARTGGDGAAVAKLGLHGARDGAACRSSGCEPISFRIC